MHRGGGGSKKPKNMRTIVLIGWVKSVQEGVKKAEQSAYVLNGCSQTWSALVLNLAQNLAQFRAQSSQCQLNCTPGLLARLRRRRRTLRRPSHQVREGGREGGRKGLCNDFNFAGLQKLCQVLFLLPWQNGCVLNRRCVTLLIISR